jgi:HSP20 family protein
MARNELIPQEHFSLFDPSFNLSDMFKDFGNRFALSRLMNMEQSGVELSEDSTNVYIHAPMPGINPNQIDVMVENGVVQIKGERQEEEKDKNKKFYRRAQRSFWYQVALPAQVDETQAKCDCAHGILELTLPKAKAAQGKKIKVNIKQPAQE